MDPFYASSYTSLYPTTCVHLNDLSRVFQRAVSTLGLEPCINGQASSLGKRSVSICSNEVRSSRLKTEGECVLNASFCPFLVVPHCLGQSAGSSQPVRRCFGRGARSAVLDASYSSFQDAAGNEQMFESGPVVKPISSVGFEGYDYLLNVYQSYNLETGIQKGAYRCRQSKRCGCKATRQVEFCHGVISRVFDQRRVPHTCT